MDTPTFFAAFLAGILSFLSPCILPLLPGYISFISGESIETLRSGDKISTRFKAFFGAVFFGIGFTLVFIALGATATIIGKTLVQYQTALARVGGVIVFILGLHMAGVFKLNFLLKQVKFNRKKGSAPFYVEAFILGIVFVLGWTPCVGPILAGVLAIASQENSVNQGILLLLTYSLGLWIPFMVAALAINETMAAIKKAGKYFVWIERIAGVLLMLIGLALITDNMTRITAFLLGLTNG